MEVYSFKTIPPSSKFFAIKGIYGIRCVEDNKWYVGQAVNLYNRLKNHRSALLRQKGSVHLQRAYNKYGADSFEVYILEIVASNGDLNAAERHYMDEFKSYDREHGFNIGYFKPDLTPAFYGTHRERNPNYKRVFGWGDVQVIRELWKEGYNNGDIRKIYKVSTSCIAEIVSNYKWRHPDYVRPKPDERAPLKFEQRKLVDKHILYGDTAEDVYKATGIQLWRISKYFKIKGVPTNRRFSRLMLDTYTGVYYDSITDAARALGVKKGTLKWWITSRPDLNKTGLRDVDDKVKEPLLFDPVTKTRYTVGEVALLHGVSHRTIKNWIARPEINKSNLVIVQQEVENPTK